MYLRILKKYYIYKRNLCIAYYKVKKTRKNFYTFLVSMTTSGKYSVEQMAAIKAVPIEDVLVDLGYPVKSDSKGFICSPFRNERTGSFKIDRAKNFWCDFGESNTSKVRTGRTYLGGTVIDLVMMLRNCSVAEALAYLVELKPGIAEGRCEFVKASAQYESRSETKISRVGELYTYSLKDYVSQERMIPLEIASRYLSQIYYKNVTPGKPAPEKDFFAIGFPNRSGSWIIRSQYTDRSTGEVQQIKRNIGVSDCTLIGKDGGFITGESMGLSSNVAVFEGFFNFLSWLAWKGIEIPGNTDVVVLNSTTNAERALPFIACHKNVYTYLDNDQAGDNCTENIMTMCGAMCDDEFSITVRDCRSAYRDFNDLNDAWKEVCRQRRQEREQEKGQGMRR